MSANQIGEFLAALRKARGFTQQEVAEKLGVSNKTVSSWETGTSCPDISMLPVLAELYEVTCDEIVKGKRINTVEPEKVSQAKRENANKLLQKQKSDITVVYGISISLTLAGILLTSIIGYVATESLLGFFIGLILLIASVITAAILIRKIRFSLGEEWLNEGTVKVFSSADKAIFRIVCANIAALGFIAPHAFAPVHTGLQLNLFWITSQLICCAVAFIVAMLAGTPIYIRHRRKVLQQAATNEAPKSVKEALSRAIKTNVIARWRYKYISLIIILPLALPLTISLISIAVLSDFNYSTGLPQTVYLNSEESLSLPDGPFGPFSRGEYTVVSEEQPKEQTDTGKYAVTYLFDDFDEMWRYYYLTEDTSEGTLVTIYKYRYKVEFFYEVEYHEFYAYNREWQGGITNIKTNGYKYEDENGNIENFVSISFKVQPSLFEIYETQRKANIIDGLIWGAMGIGVAGIATLSVTVLVYIKKERAFKKSLT